MESYNIIECYYNINITLDEKRDAKFLSFFAELVTKVTFLKEGDKETILFVLKNILCVEKKCNTKDNTINTKTYKSKLF